MDNTLKGDMMTVSKTILAKALNDIADIAMSGADQLTRTARCAAVVEDLRRDRNQERVWAR